MPVDERTLATALANRGLALRELDRLDAEARLIDYIRLLWPVLEPKREFKTGWAIEAVCEHLEYVHHGHIKRLLINVPPGFMKSMTVNVFFPTWEWGPRNSPQLRYVHASYSPDLTVRDNRKARALIRSELYQSFWGDRFQIVSDQDAKVKFENDHAGFKLATSIGGVGTGERGDRGVIDDPHKVKEAESEKKLESALLWFAEEWPSRINDPEESVQLCIMQRVHARDVSGMILASELDYVHLMIPMEFEPSRRCYTVVRPPWLAGDAAPVRWARLDAEGRTVTQEEAEEPWLLDEARQMLLTRHERDGTLRWRDGYPADPRTEEGELAWPERFTRRHLEEELKPQLRMIGGTYAEAGQLQQRPVPRGGGLYKREWFQPVPRHQVPRGGRVVRGWDLAGSKKKTSAYSACVKMRRVGKAIYIEHAFRERMTPNEVETRIRSFAELDGRTCAQDFPQDPGQAGLAQKSAIAALLNGYDVRFSPESGSKEDRAKPLAAQAEAGNVYIVEGPWNEEFLAELEQFPRGMFKDMADAASRAYARLIRKGEAQLPAGPELVHVGESASAAGYSFGGEADDEEDELYAFISW